MGFKSIVEDSVNNKNIINNRIIVEMHKRDMCNEDILNKYEKVKTSLEKAIADSDSIELSGKDENKELASIINTLKKLNDDFKSEIEKLEKSSEWNKFCIAFFGETNAGKSTIIEALRIVYDEELRRREINEQKMQLYEELNNEKNQYSELVNSLKELNKSINSKKINIKNFIIWIGLIILGVVIGFVIAYLFLKGI